jgi:hypothetical protein
MHMCSLYNGSDLQQSHIIISSQGVVKLFFGYVQGNNMDALVFLLHKELRPSDVSNLGRIVLPKVKLRLH